MPLSKLQFEAVHLVMEDRMPDKAIAVRLGVDERTLRRWKQTDEFKGAVRELRVETFRELKEHLLSSVEGRIAHKLERHRRYAQIIEERAAAADGSGVPGASTGLLVKHIKLGKDAVYEEYTVDTAISREMAQLESEIGQELREAGIKIEEPVLPVNLQTLNWEELEILERLDKKVREASKIPMSQRKPYVPTEEEQRARREKSYAQQVEMANQGRERQGLK